MSDFESGLTDTLAVIEERLMAASTADSPFATEAAQHIISAGGKRFRPMLVCLAAQFGEVPDEEALIKAALVMELTHVASLYHDDVMDDADIRRGAPSANRRWNNSIAIMVGDYLFARASVLVAELGVEYVSLQAKTFARLVQGQIAETRGPQAGDDALAHYLQVIADKTGSLIAASALFGGMVAGASQEVLRSLAAFGEEIGLVFQLSDDLIDIMSDATGKTPGIDLREGVPTLPILMLRGSSKPEDVALLGRIDAGLQDDAELREVVTRLREHPIMAEARIEVERRAEVAKSYLLDLPEGPAKDALISVCRDLVERSA